MDPDSKEQQLSKWSVNQAEGFADGPTEELSAAGVVVTLGAVWTKEDGVCVVIDTGDEVLPASLALAAAEAMQRLAAIPAPELSAI